MPPSSSDVSHSREYLLYDISMTNTLGGYSLETIVQEVRSYAGMTGKKPISAVSNHLDTSDPVHGPGDDGAIVETNGVNIVACGEALAPSFVAGDPYGAGIAAVLANANDVAAMGGVPLAIVNTLVGPPEVTSIVMQGMVAASKMYDVPIVGGHLTERPGDTSVSAFALGPAERVLSMTNVRPGQTILFAAFLDGTMRPDFPFFTSIDEQANRFDRDIRVPAQVAAAGAAVAAKDVSMAGPLGSLAMLLEFSKCGADVDLDRLPTPVDTDVLKWLICFPSYAFWFTAEPKTADRCVEIFESNDLTCTTVGTVRADGRLVLHSDSESIELMNFDDDVVTGLWA